MEICEDRKNYEKGNREDGNPRGIQSDARLKAFADSYGNHAG